MTDKPDKGQHAGMIDFSNLDHLIGYHVAQAYIPSKAAFDKSIGGPLKLRRVEFTILMLLLANPSLTQKQLSRVLAISAPNLTILLDRMAEKGWLLRTRSELDRRVQKVSLSAEGVRLGREAHERSRSCESELLSHLSSGEQGILRELLDKLARHRR